MWKTLKKRVSNSLLLDIINLNFKNRKRTKRHNRFFATDSYLDYNNHFNLGIMIIKTKC